MDYYRDSVGPLGRTVEDVALVFQALPGVDDMDGLTGLIAEYNVTVETNYTQYLKMDGLQAGCITFTPDTHSRRGCRDTYLEGGKGE